MEINSTESKMDVPFTDMILINSDKVRFLGNKMPKRGSDVTPFDQ